MEFYRELDFPPVPEELLNFDYNSKEYGEFVQDYEPRQLDYGKNHYINKKLVNPVECSIRIISYNPLAEWINKNIRPNPLHLSFLKASSLVDDGVFVAHIDNRRYCGISYIVEPGGDNVITSWYQEKGKSIIRGKIPNISPHTAQSDSGNIEYDDLILLDSVVFKKNKWYLINTAVIHDVQNINSTRLSLIPTYPESHEPDGYETLLHLLT